MNLSIDNPPTGQDIERFLAQLVDKVKPRSSRKIVPSEAWFSGGLQSLMSPLIFKYPNWNLSSHETLRIKSLLSSLTASGKLTREPDRARQWLGVILVKRMIEALLQDTIQNVTSAWSVSLSKILSLLLTSSLQCRCGDITTSSKDKDRVLPFLAWGDVRLFLHGGNTVEDLVTRIKLRGEKGHK